jgi:hypothetical protein
MGGVKIHRKPNYLILFNYFRFVAETKAAVPVQRPRVAVVASVAAPPAQKPKTATGPTDIHTHGVTYGGRLKTWTGGVVSLAAWRLLTEWEKQGPQERHWNGITKQWEPP